MSGTKDRATLELLVTAWMADEGSPSGAPEALLDRGLRTNEPAASGPALARVAQRALDAQPDRSRRRDPGARSRSTVILAALVALTAALVVIGSQLLQPMPRAVSGEDWPMFRGDATRAGFGLRGPVGNPVIQWTFHARGAITKNISIVGDSAYVLSDEGVLHALRLEGGTEQRSLDVGPAVPASAS